MIRARPRGFARFSFACLAVVTCALTTRGAAAQQPAPSSDAPPPPEWVEADKLFAEGRAALARPRDLAKACDILARSYALRQRGDTLLNLAECHRRQGKTATAWREFDEAIRFAVDVEFREAIDAAVSRRDELAATLSELYVVVDDKTLPADTHVVLDGKKLLPQQWNERLFVDPGKHVVTATATGYEPFEGSVEIAPKAKDSVIRVTPKKLPEAPPPPPPVAPKPKTAAPPKQEAPPEPMPVWPFVVGGAGIAAMGVAVVFGIDSLGAGSELDDKCGEARDACPRGYDFESDRAEELRSFGFYLGLGVAGLAATTVGTLGIVLHDGSRKSSATIAPWATPESAGVVLRGVAF